MVYGLRSMVYGGLYLVLFGLGVGCQEGLVVIVVAVQLVDVGIVVVDIAGRRWRHGRLEHFGGPRGHIARLGRIVVLLCWRFGLGGGGRRSVVHVTATLVFTLTEMHL